jgi:hypothetical protein
MSPLLKAFGAVVGYLGILGLAGCDGSSTPAVPKSEAFCDVNAVPCAVFKYKQCCAGGTCVIDFCMPSGGDPICTLAPGDCAVPFACESVICGGQLVDPQSVSNPALCPTTLASATGAGDRLCFDSGTVQAACTGKCSPSSGALNAINWPIQGNLRSQCSATVNRNHTGLNADGFIPNGCVDPGPAGPLASQGTNAVTLTGAGTATLNGANPTVVPIIGGFFDIAAPDTTCSALQANCPTQVNQVEVAFGDFSINGHSVQGLKLKLDSPFLTASGVQSGNFFIFTIPQFVEFDAIARVDGTVTGIIVQSDQQVDGSINLTTGSLAFQFDVTGSFAGMLLEVSGVAASQSVVALAPVLTAGAITVTQSPDSCTASVALSASAVSAAGLPVTIDYIVDNVLVGTGAGATTVVSIGPRHDIVINANDSNGMRDTVTESVTVADTSPPTVTIANDGSGFAGTQWPPNHNYVSHTLADCVAQVVDQCDGTLDINTVGQIVRITSNEPENSPGDGNTCADAVITGPSSFQLRSERSGRGQGRVYTVDFTVGDDAQNTATHSCSFQVPHDQSGAPAVATAPVYCVGTNCGSLSGNSASCH